MELEIVERECWVVVGNKESNDRVGVGGEEVGEVGGVGWWG